MCGILFSIAFNDPKQTVHDELIPYISSRGPDSLQTHSVQIPISDSQRCLKLTFTSSVLHLRGQKVTVQQLISEVEDVLS